MSCIGQTRMALAVCHKDILYAIYREGWKFSSGIGVDGILDAMWEGSPKLHDSLSGTLG